MSIGGAGGNTVAFGIKAVADLRGVDQTAKALTGLSSKGAQAGTGIARGMDAAARGLDASRARAEALEHSMRGITVAAAAIVGVGVGLFKIGASFDSVLDSIAVGTGATGKALEALGNDARAVFRSIPTDMETAGLAITELARRTDQTGKGLRDLAAAEIELARITGGDLKSTIEVTAKLFESWGVAVADQVGVLDELFRASQATGVPVDRLAAQLAQYGPILRSMNFGLDESIALLSLIDRAGVDAASVITGLRTAISKFSAAGVTDLGVALQEVFTQIKNAPTDVAAAAIAIENFGSRAGPAFAENIRAGRLEYQDMLAVIRDGESTIRDTAEATNDSAEKFKLLKNQVTDALVPLGTQFFNLTSSTIPAITALAKGIGFAGEAFSKLPSSIKIAAGAIVGLAVGFAAITAVGARIVGIGASTVAAWSSVAGIFSTTAVASGEAAVGIAAAGAAAQASAGSITALAVAESELAATSTRLTGAKLAGLGGPLAIALAAITLEVLHVKNAADEAARSFEHLKDQIKDANDIAQQFKLQGLDEASADATRIGEDFQLVSDILDKAHKEASIGGFGGFFDDPLGGLDKMAHALPGLANDWEITAEAAKKADEAQQEVLSHLSDPNIDTSKLEAAVTAATTAFAQTGDADAYVAAIDNIIQHLGDYKKSTDEQAQSQEDANAALRKNVEETIKQKREQEQLSRAVKDTLNQQFLASASAKGLLLPYTRDAENAEEATSQFNRTLGEMETEAVNAALGIADIAPELAGMQAGFGKVGDSLVNIFRKMDDAGVVDFSPAVREALDAVAALTKVEAKIADVEAAITNNQGDLSMWAGRISLVTDTFGANSQQVSEWLELLQTGQITQEQFNANIAALAASGGFPKLDTLLAQGKITQEEYAAAVEAGTHLLQRSAGALQDEEAEIVRNIIALDAYVKQHDDADGSVKGLTESQRGFIAAMSDSKVQTYLQTLQLLFYLATIGQIPAEKVTEFIVNSGQADPVIAAVNRDLGLLPDEKSIVVSANVNNAINDMQQVKGVIIATTADGATITVNADTQEAAQKFLDLNENELATLDGRELIVRVKGDDGEWETVRQEIIDQDFADKTVTVRAQAEAGLANIPVLGGSIPQPNVPETDQPEPIVFTATDEVTPVTETIAGSVTTLETDVGTSVANIDANVSSGLEQGFANGATAAQTGAAGIVSALDLGPTVYNYGFNDGYSFGVGLANGITATFNAVYNAAFNVGYAANLGTKAGMQAHSPSRLAIEAGTNWGKSVADAIRAQTGNVRSAGEEMSRVLQGTIADPSTNPTLRGLLTVDQRPADILAQSAGRGDGGSRSTVVNVHQTNQFHGVTDTDEIVGHVTVELSRAWERGMTAGVFGS